MTEASYTVHPSAYVDQPCEIGAGTKIWHFCHVMAGARIGARCNLGQNVFVANDTLIGRQRQDPEQCLGLRRRDPGR